MATLWAEAEPGQAVEQRCRSPAGAVLWAPVGAIHRSDSCTRVRVGMYALVRNWCRGWGADVWLSPAEAKPSAGVA